jgi:hypothetical protein
LISDLDGESIPIPSEIAQFDSLNTGPVGQIDIDKILNVSADVHHIASGPARDDEVAQVGSLDIEGVVAQSPDKRGSAIASDIEHGDVVVAVAAVNGIRAAVAVEAVRSDIADNEVVAICAGAIGATATGEHEVLHIQHIAGGEVERYGGLDRVAAIATGNCVSESGYDEEVVAIRAIKRGFAVADERVIAGATGQALHSATGLETIIQSRRVTGNCNKDILVISDKIPTGERTAGIRIDGEKGGGIFRCGFGF